MYLSSCCIQVFSLYAILQSLLYIQNSAIEDSLALKISSDCSCSLNKEDFHDSKIDCKDDSELVYSADLKYSNDDGSETASVIASRLTSQTPFSITIQGMPVTVTSVSTDCAPTSLSPAVGGGLFVGGFVIAAVLISIIALVIVV